MLSNWKSKIKCNYLYKVTYYNKRTIINEKKKLHTENKQEENTFDLKEKTFFNNLHKEWWDKKNNNHWYDKIERLMGSGMYSLHDYNEHRFNFIFKNFEFIYYEKLKNENDIYKKTEEVETLRILDVGCGGGILCEYLKKHLYQFLVKKNMLFKNKNMELKKWNIYIDGIDVSDKLIEVAKLRQYENEQIKKGDLYHTIENDYKNEYCNIYLNYKNCDISELVRYDINQNSNQHMKWNHEENDRATENYNEKIDKKEKLKHKKEEIDDKTQKKENKYDIIISSEVIEHIPNEKKESFIKYISLLSKDNTIVVFTTINKNMFSYLYSIVLAEYITGFIKRGTHEYNKFIDEEELSNLCSLHNLIHLRTENVIYLPILRNYFITNKLKLLYLSAFVHKPIY